MGAGLAHHLAARPVGAGRRTTLEFLPAVWLFGTNNDYVGQTLKNRSLFQLDAHLSAT